MINAIRTKYSTHIQTDFRTAIKSTNSYLACSLVVACSFVLKNALLLDAVIRCVCVCSEKQKRIGYCYTLSASLSLFCWVWEWEWRVYWFYSCSWWQSKQNSAPSKLRVRVKRTTLILGVGGGWTGNAKSSVKKRVNVYGRWYGFEEGEVEIWRSYLIILCFWFCGLAPKNLKPKKLIER